MSGGGVVVSGVVVSGVVVSGVVVSGVVVSATNTSSYPMMYLLPIQLRSPFSSGELKLPVA